MKNKQNEVNQDSCKKGEQNNTAHRLYRKHKKNILKTIKLTENTNIRKAMAIH